MLNIHYLKIFRATWKIAWKNRFLWWFGFFMLLINIINPNYFLGNDNEKPTEWKKIFEQIDLHEFILSPAKMVFWGASAFIFFLMVVGLYFIGKGAIIKSTQYLIEKKPINFKIGLIHGKKYFWNNFKIVFFSGLFLMICLLILIAPIAFLFFRKVNTIAFVLAIFAILIIIPLVVIYNYIQIYACLYGTLADLNVGVAMENAYAIFKKNIFSSILMSVLLILFNFVAVFIARVAFFIFFPILNLLISSHYAILTLVPTVILFILVSWVYAIFIAFSQIAWVLFFYKIATPKNREKVLENVKEREADKIEDNSTIVDGVNVSK